MSIEDRGAMVALRKEGRTFAQLAHEYNRPESTLRNVWKHYQAHGTVELSYGKGRPRKLDEQAEDRLVRSVHRDPKQTAAQLAATEDVSSTTVRKILHKRNINSRVCRTKPIIPPTTAKKRLDWAENVEGMDWRRVIFTDEAAFAVGDDVARVRCWREPGMEYEEKYLTTKKRKGAAVHVWGAIMHGKKFPLHFFDLAKAKRRKSGNIKAQTINATVYCEQVLWGPMQAAVNEAKRDGRDPLVVEDGAPVHFKGVAKDIRPMLDITNLPHPPSSPDLNPIEGCWNMLKDHIRRMPGRPSSAAALKEAIEAAWDALDQETVNRLVLSMEDRRIEVVRKVGLHTHW
jgi:transposase